MRPPAAAAMRILVWVWVASAPLALQVGVLAYGLAVVRWIRAAPPLGPVAMLLALPPLVAEFVFTRAFEVSTRGYRTGVVVGLIGRLLFAACVGYLFVVFPLQVKGTTDNWLPQDLAELPSFLGIVWRYNPIPATILALVCTAVYAWWTVRRRQARLTSTVLLPGLATALLFVLLYYFPAAAIRGISGTRLDFITRVWTPTNPDHRIPRELMVTPDERYAVATFGSTFPVGAADPSPDTLDLGPRCALGAMDAAAECRRNLALIDLQTGAIRTWSMTITRRFQSEASDRIFVVPYRIHYLIELGLDGSVQTHALPDSIGGHLVDEVNDTYYAADTGRVYMANGNNPVVLAWDTNTERLEKVLQLAGWNGLALGDVPLNIARSRSRRRLYVTVKADHPQVVELDEKELKPLRSFGPAGYDVEVSPDEKSLYVASFLTGDIWRFNADTLELEAALDAPIQCRRVSFSPDGSQMFAASYLTGELVVYDTETNVKLNSFYVAPRLEGMHVAGGGLYLLSAEGLYRVPLDLLKRYASRTGP